MFLTKKYKQRIAELEDRNKALGDTIDHLVIDQKEMIDDVSELLDAMNEMKEKSDKIDEILEDYENMSIEKSLAKKADEPWAGLSVSEVDPETGKVGLKLDWNDRFQEHLKRSGIPGNTDDERMSIWFASLIKEWGEEIDEETAKEYREDLR